MNHDGSLPPGVKVVPFYDRGSLIAVTTHTVLHNLIFGCLLVFLIQWIFLGDLRSAIIVGLNIPFALLFAIILLVMRGESANLLSLGAVDFGIIVDSAVILVENIFRNFQRVAGRKAGPAPTSGRRLLGNGPDAGCRPRRAGPRMDGPFAADSDQRDAGGQGGAFLGADHRGRVSCRCSPCRESRAQIFGPMARTYAYALAGALIATFTVTPVLASLLLPEQVKESETIVVRGLHRLYNPALRFALAHRAIVVGIGIVFLAVAAFFGSRLGSEFLPHLEEGNLWIRASMPMTLSLQDGEAATRKMRLILLKHPEVITVVSQHGRPDDGSDASPFSNVELFVPLKPYDQWPKGMTKEKLTEQTPGGVRERIARASTSISPNTSRTTSRRRSRASKAPIPSRSSAPISRP